MDFAKKYGQWGMVLGATEGIGKAAAFELAKRGMHVVLVGRRKEALEIVGKEIERDTRQKAKVLLQDLSERNASEKLIQVTKDLDMGVVIFVACLHAMGIYFQNDYQKYEQMFNLNIKSFSKFLYHYTGYFKARARGAFVTIGSLSGWTSLPFCAEYAAQKAYMMTLTEGVAYELSETKVDLLLLTAGSTITPEWLNNKPSDPEQVASAMYPEEVMKEGLDQLGKKMSYIVGEKNRAAYHRNGSKERDEVITGLGQMFKHIVNK